MVSASDSHLWLRRLVFALFLGFMAWGYVHLAGRTIRQAAQTAASSTPLAGPYAFGRDQSSLSALEARHLQLTWETRQDLRPDFSESVSGPLKKLAPHRTDGMVQPLWPWLAAWLVGEQENRPDLERAAWFKVGLSLGGLAVLALVCFRCFALPAALLVVAVTAFHGLLGTVAVFTGATMFHIFFLLAWIACLYALQRNSLWVYGLVGSLGALAYLSADRITPLIAVFLVISSLRALWGWLAAFWNPRNPREGTSLWVRRNHVFGLLLLATCAGFIVGPRMVTAWEKFGQPAFQYSDHVRWLDSEAEARAWVEQHPDRASLEKESALSLPSPALYFQTHTPEAAARRLLAGLHTLASRLQARGGAIVAILLVLIPAFTVLCRFCTPPASHAGERLHPETVPTVLFIVTATLAYLVIAAWDVAVMPANHLHALAGPLTLSLLWGCESVLRRARRRGAGRLVAWSYQGMVWVLFAITLLQFWTAARPAL